MRGEINSSLSLGQGGNPLPACPKYVRLSAGIGSPGLGGGRRARQNRIWVGVEEEEKRNKLTLCVCSIFHVYGFLIQFIEFLFSYFVIGSFRHGRSLGGCEAAGLFSAPGLCQFEIGR